MTHPTWNDLNAITIERLTRELADALNRFPSLKEYQDEIERRDEIIRSQEQQLAEAQFELAEMTTHANKAVDSFNRTLIEIEAANKRADEFQKQVEDDFRLRGSCGHIWDRDYQGDACPICPQLTEAQATIEDLQQKIRTVEHLTLEIQNRIPIARQQLEAERAKHREEIETVRERIISNCDRLIADRDAALEFVQHALAERDSQIATMCEALERFNRDETIDRYSREHDLEITIQSKDAQIASLMETIKRVYEHGSEICIAYFPGTCFKNITRHALKTPINPRFSVGRIELMERVVEVSIGLEHNLYLEEHVYIRKSRALLRDALAELKVLEAVEGGADG